MGVVLACDAEPESAKLKYLFDVAPASACLTPELLRLVHFLKERTFCTYYEAVKAVIPYGAQYKPAVAADGVTPVLQKQLTRHTENSYRLTPKSLAFCQSFCTFGFSSSKAKDWVIRKT